MAHERSPVIVAMADGDGRVVDAMEGMDGRSRLTVRTARHGELRFTSTPGDTRFQVLLPRTQTG